MMALPIAISLKLSIKSPLSVGPKVMPSPAVVPKKAKALSRSFSSKLFTKIAEPQANTLAPPMPATALPISNIMSEVAKLDTKEPSKNKPTPNLNALVAPNLSLKLPQISVKQAKKRLKALTTHCKSVGSSPKSLAI